MKEWFKNLFRHPSPAQVRKAILEDAVQHFNQHSQAAAWHTQMAQVYGDLVHALGPRSS